MSVNIRYPNITDGTEREQMSQVKSYLHQLVEQLNYALPTIGTGDGSTKPESSGTHDVQGGELSYYELKSLIVHELQQIDAEVAKAVDEALEKAIENGEFNGVSPTVSVTEIDGGHRVTITDKDGAKTFDVMDGKDGTGGGGTSEAIIDVVELPTENINEDVFYRLLTGTFVFNQYTQNGYTCHCVDGLPDVGEPAANAEMSAITAYYNTQDNEVYGYVDTMLSMFFGIPVGWYPAAMLFQAAGVPYAGVITDIMDDPRDDTLRVLLEYVVHSYKDGKWTSHKTIGWVGAGNGAEVFNHPANKAYGMVSHAEGRSTVAGEEGVESYGAHAEGWKTKALIDAAHAEGMDTTASGLASHAEGRYTTASGGQAHAEGDRTTASGHYSHSEGDTTVANGRACHVQGRYNIIEDVPGEPHVNYGKYAHIVGNGAYNARSNAHTLDWHGLGWFAGGLKVGGTGQDDPNAEEILTKSQVQALVASGGIAADHIVEQGTSGIWTYRKWNSGKIELWTNSHQFTVSFTKSSIGVYYATQSGIAVPLVKTIEFASGDCTKWHYVNWASVTCNGGTELGIRYYGLNGNGDGGTIPFSMYVIGTWK